ncbi:MAG: hypothetical protein ABR987_22505 [Terracidiphilus sp.]|jgi:ubiquinone biosynthesis protein UbiJ
MTLSEEIRKLSEDCLALELRELNLRLDVLESNAGIGPLRVELAMMALAKGIDTRIYDAERLASERHAQTMRALDLLADTWDLREQVACLEARELTKARG